MNSKNATASELASREKAFREKDEQAKKLEDTLVKLQKQKNEHENDLLEKFSLLLNEKKLKIRDQQRLLASLNVDPARLAAVEENRNERHHSAGPSRRGKRKARPRVQGDDDDEESDGFEDMDVDEAPNESEQDQPQTPPPEDESTADEASEDEEAPVPPPTRRNHRGSPAEATSSRAPPLPKDAAVPPKRELPFQKKPTPAKPAPVINGSETESDDEL